MFLFSRLKCAIIAFSLALIRPIEWLYPKIVANMKTPQLRLSSWGVVLRYKGLPWSFGSGVRGGFWRRSTSTLLRPQSSLWSSQRAGNHLIPAILDSSLHRNNVRLPWKQILHKMADKQKAVLKEVEFASQRTAFCFFGLTARWFWYWTGLPQG